MRVYVYHLHTLTQFYNSFGQQCVALILPQRTIPSLQEGYQIWLDLETTTNSRVLLEHAVMG